MMVNTRGSIVRLLAWQWRRALLFASAAVAAQLMHHVPRWTHLVLPALPLAVTGGALGIFVSFRTNSCYARWWEARGLWGRLVNVSRHLASQVLTTLADDATEARAIVRRQIAYVHVLRCALRDQDPWQDADVLAFTTEAEREPLRRERNAPYAIVHAQHAALARLAAAGRIDPQRMLALDASLLAVLDVQGGSERIKKTPFPRGYAFISDRLIVAFGCLLPFAMVRELQWAVIPMNLLVCGAFALINEAGRVLEDPFTLYWNALPLTALSKTIEVNLRQRLGEPDVPAIPGPDGAGILM